MKSSARRILAGLKHAILIEVSHVVAAMLELFLPTEAVPTLKALLVR